MAIEFIIRLIGVQMLSIFLIPSKVVNYFETFRTANAHTHTLLCTFLFEKLKKGKVLDEKRKHKSLQATRDSNEQEYYQSTSTNTSVIFHWLSFCSYVYFCCSKRHFHAATIQ